MERRSGQHHTGYILTPEERSHVQQVDPWLARMAIRTTPDGGGTISFTNDPQGKRSQAMLEQTIKDAGFPIVDTHVPPST